MKWALMRMARHHNHGCDEIVYFINFAYCRRKDIYDFILGRVTLTAAASTWFS